MTNMQKMRVIKEIRRHRNIGEEMGQKQIAEWDFYRAKEKVEEEQKR